MLRWKSLGELSPIDITWSQEVSVLMSWTRSSHLGGSGPTPGWSTKTLPATQLGRRRKKRTARTPNQMIKAKLNRENHTKKHTHSQKEKKQNKKIKK